ncbi:rho GTPase-activating protein conundrum [Chrysoperla carnea]|uniref:rho GTPase-activating protein conundrum n=1 Tax=Chrysoperla carnea TaxID=189513 RepID=UPI001D06FB7F|nr:rho GTPase-activating protein conundrum [Chrysoperla carnea]XP_044741572.1 rho GTPase-activating protein conundrum [Chrysoperla carnea]XP_044741573.1 rho GTPase-activating protein conundrum [Chrysoperla carnea]
MYANDDYKDFWNEYKLVQETKHTATTEDEDHTKLEVDEVENDTELLRVMGMGHLVEVFNQCRQITDQQLDMSLRQLSKRQADTVRKRVRALNYTVKSRAHLAGAHVASRNRGWQRKPDIRNVFKSDVDVETADVDDTGNGNDSTGTRSRSRSATPDSLDFDSIQSTPIQSTTTDWNATNWNTNAATSTQHDQSAHTNNHHPHSSNNLVGSVPSFVKIFHQSDLEQAQITSAHRSSSESEKDTLRRTPSAPPSCNRNRGLESKSEDNCDTSNHVPSILPSTEMFGRPNWSHYREAVASNSEGIELLGFNRIGTMYCPRNSRERGRLIRDPQPDTQTSSTHRRNVDALIDSPTLIQHPHRSHAQSSFHPSIPSNGPMSFEMAFNNNRSSSTIKQEESLNLYQNETNIVNIDVNYSSNEQRISVNQVTDLDFKDMTPMLWLEICMLFDKHSLKIHRRKPLKRKRKEDGNLFGVNLSTLVMRDYQFINNDNDHDPCNASADNSANSNTTSSDDAVPLIIRDLLSRLSTDARLKEEGLLRVAGNKQRVELLCTELEQHFYTKQESCKALLNKSTSHELVSILKKILRDLPQPLFTTELIHLFYETHAIQDPHDQLNALNLLILLLPVQNRTTLYALLEFFIQVVRHQHFNKMNLHNVAMIIAPSLFPPRYIFTTKSQTKNNDLNSEIAFAATCCKLTETLIEHVQLLQTIPVALLKQARTTNTTRN